MNHARVLVCLVDTKFVQKVNKNINRNNEEKYTEGFYVFYIDLVVNFTYYFNINIILGTIHISIRL